MQITPRSGRTLCLIALTFCLFSTSALAQTKAALELDGFSALYFEGAAVGSMIPGTTVPIEITKSGPNAWLLRVSAADFALPEIQYPSGKRVLWKLTSDATGGLSASGAEVVCQLTAAAIAYVDGNTSGIPMTLTFSTETLSASAKGHTAKFMALNHNLTSTQEYLLAPADLRWFGVFSFSDDGYVKDDEKIDAGGILDSIKEGTEQGNKERRAKGWGEMHIVGWKIPPYYDQETKRLEWAVNAKDDNDAAVVNFNTRILGRGGVTSAVLVADPSNLDSAVQEFKRSMKHYDYNNGERYAEYKPGDKVAEYGLAALVGGGAAAVAVKSGLWKTILAAAIAGWKFVVAAVVGVLAWVSKRFKSKDS